MPYSLKPSRIWLSILFAGHLLALLSVSLTNLPLWARAVLILPVALSLFHHLHSRDRRVWASFSLEKNHVSVNASDGDALHGELMPRTLVTPLCVVLHARFERKHVCQLIFRDAMEPNAFRELRVRLRFC